jgi:hypothetical protein
MLTMNTRRAATVYRISRFPVNYSSGLNAEAFKRGTAAYLQADRYFSPPVYEQIIPHTHGIGEEVNSEIRTCIRIPTAAFPSSSVPVILYICRGLDAYGTDKTVWISEHVSRGLAVIAVNIPGTGDCPAIRRDPRSPDRLFSSVLDRIDAQEMLDSGKIVARGISTGGHYAVSIVHTHKDRILAGFSHGGTHYMFDRKWIEAQNGGEYPFA